MAATPHNAPGAGSGAGRRQDTCAHYITGRAQAVVVRAGETLQVLPLMCGCHGRSGAAQTCQLVQAARGIVDCAPLPVNPGADGGVGDLRAESCWNAAPQTAPEQATSTGKPV